MVLSNVRARMATATAGGNFVNSLSRSWPDSGSVSFAVRFGALRLGIPRVVSSGMGLLTVPSAAIESAAALSVNACVIANKTGHTRMDLVIGQDGFLSQPDLRDGYVLGLRLLNKSSLQLSAQTEKGEAFTLWLDGLQRLRCDGFGQENIIFSIEITRNAQPKLETLHRLTGEPPAREPYRSRHQEWIDELSREIVAGRMTLVSLEPSYGCMVTALCETIRISAGVVPPAGATQGAG